MLRNTAVIIVYGEPMELPRCGAEKICHPGRDRGRAAESAAAATCVGGIEAVVMKIFIVTAEF